MRPLTTARLRLRPLTTADLPAVLAIHQHPGLARFVPRAFCHDLDDAAALRTRLTADDGDPVLGVPAIEVPATLADGGGDGPGAAWDTGPDGAGHVVGLVMLKPIPPSGRGLAPTARPGPNAGWDIEIGWRGHPAYAGRGYLTEAAAAVLGHAFANGVPRIVAVTDPANLPSRRVAERIGMRAAGLTSAYYDTSCALFEATAEDHLPADGAPRVS